MDCAELVKFAEEFEDILISKTHPFLCTESGQNEIINDIQEKNLNRIIAAA
ncbi:MAG: hypothetical protein GF311_11405 [Candidatus Lokiarchaeota archaeon]|nr:hypothetical protein [Candidatus Lokiarchaeota archaeon]